MLCLYLGRTVGGVFKNAGSIFYGVVAYLNQTFEFKNRWCELVLMIADVLN